MGWVTLATINELFMIFKFFNFNFDSLIQCIFISFSTVSALFLLYLKYDFLYSMVIFCGLLSILIRNQVSNIVFIINCICFSLLIIGAILSIFKWIVHALLIKSSSSEDVNNVPTTDDQIQETENDTPMDNPSELLLESQ